jgi:flagellar biosynthesis anti-sigma factor FlgM
MKAVVRKHSSHPLGVEPPGALAQSPEKSDSATSGTYFRAIRPTDGEAEALARGESVIDRAKVERLRAAIEAGTWQADSEVMAQRMLDEAGRDPDIDR